MMLNTKYLSSVIIVVIEVKIKNIKQHIIANKTA